MRRVGSSYLFSLIDDGGRRCHTDASRQSVSADDYLELDETVPVGIADRVSLRGERCACNSDINDCSDPGSGSSHANVSEDGHGVVDCGFRNLRLL